MRKLTVKETNWLTQNDIVSIKAKIEPRPKLPLTNTEIKFDKQKDLAKVLFHLIFPI